MNYKNIYKQLIEKRRVNVLIRDRKNKPGFVECHHIIPKSLGGSDDKNNLINFTPKEHFIAHLLLEKIYPDSIEMKYAVSMLVMRFKNLKYIKINSKQYDRIKREMGNLFSKTRRGKNNPVYGLHYVHMYHSETKEMTKVLPEMVDEYIKCGWVVGYLMTERRKENLIKLNDKLKELKTLGISIKGFKGSRKIVNRFTKRVTILSPTEILTDDMKKSGWEYGIFKSDKFYEGHRRKSKKFIFNNKEMTLKEISNCTGKPVSSIKNILRRGSTIEEAVEKDKNKHFITFKGERKSITEWAKIFHLQVCTLFSRLKRHNFDLNEALKIKSKKRNVKYVYNGEEGTIPYFAKKYGIKNTTLRKYVNIDKMDIKDAIQRGLNLNNKKL